MSEHSFKDLYQMIFTALLQSQNHYSQYSDARLITMSLFYYYKHGKNNETYLILNEVIKKQGSFPIWMTEDFWKYWFDVQIEETDNAFSEIDDFHFNIILSLASTMHDLHIENKFIIKCLYEDIGKSYINDVIFFLFLGKSFTSSIDYFEEDENLIIEMINKYFC